MMRPTIAGYTFALRKVGTAMSSSDTSSSRATAGGQRVTSVAELRAWVGQVVGVSAWHTVTQAQVNLFADATDDHQYIHIDPERAKETFFGGTVAHGYLTLSLGLPDDPAQSLKLDLPGTMWVNYGLNRVRFPAPVRVGARIRDVSTLLTVEEIGTQALQLVHQRVVEIEGGEKPALVAETIARLYY